MAGNGWEEGGLFFGIDNQTGNTKCVQSQPHHVPHIIMSNNCIS